MCITGNPMVTPEVTRDVCLLARMMAANLYFSQIEDLMFELIEYAGVYRDNKLSLSITKMVFKYLLLSIFAVVYVALQ